MRIAAILHALDADLLSSHDCYFGGGTAIVLTHSEYRESLDIGFLISNIDGYGALRHLITGKKGINSIARTGSMLKSVREVRADQYGIRTMLQVADIEIKFEIVLESRIKLEKPGSKDRVCGVETLTSLDMAATKLLANSDRWADESTFCRDLIDISMINLSKTEFSHALKKAAQAYGESVRRDLIRAIEKLKKKPTRLDDCMDALMIEGMPKALIWKRIRTLNSWIEEKT